MIRKIMMFFMMLTMATSCSSAEDDFDFEPQQEESNNSNGSSQNGSKSLIAYYSYTNNSSTLAKTLQSQTGADIIEIQPSEEGLAYDANNYEIGAALIQAIKDNPNSASSYPSIKTTIDNLADYDTIYVVTPLWWRQMSAPMQSFLFTYGSAMSGKTVGLVVSSQASGITGVEEDARRLIPNASWLNSLHIRSGQTSNASALISSWLSSFVSTTAVQQAKVATANIVSAAVYDTLGQRINNTGDTTGLRAGAYIVVSKDETGYTSSQKVLVR